MGKITHIDGNLFDSTAEILCHQVNTYGVMGAGIAAEVKRRFPNVYEQYKTICRRRVPDWLYGQAMILDTGNERGQKIANLFGQKAWLTDYPSIKSALRWVVKFAEKNGIKSVAMPYKMSCGLAGGDWNTVLGIIHEVFEPTDIDVEIWRLDK